jgi:serine phosphatase RsbU (regulator of sigma subunit)
MEEKIQCLHIFNLSKNSNQKNQLRSLVALLLVGYSCYADQLVAEKGIFDTRATERDFYVLDGEWQVEWMQYLSDSEAEALQAKTFRYVPLDWIDYPKDKVAYQRHGFASYRLKVIFSPRYPKKLAFRVQTAGTCYRFFVDGQEMGSNGSPGYDAASTKNNYEPKLYFFERKSDTVSLLFHVATFNYRKGGLWQSVLVGTQEAILRERDRLVFFDLFLFGSILIIAFYHFGLFALRKDDKLSLYFAFLSLSVGVRLISTGEKLIIIWFENFNWEALIKMELGSVMIAPIAMTYYLDKLYPNKMHSWFILGVTYTFLSFFIFTLLTPAALNSYLVPACNFIWLFLILYQTAFVIRNFIEREPDSLVMAFGLILSFGFVVNDLLYNAGILNTGYSLPWAVFVFFFSQAFLLSRRFSRAYIQISQLSEELKNSNENLEEKIRQRTQELEKITKKTLALNQQINKALELVEKQKSQIEQKNRSITAAINYGSKIQKGVLPSDESVRKVLGSHFLIFEPKDIVSGDFYWAKSFETHSYFVLADCTGHGVPGAFMSLISIVLLQQIAMPEKDPGEIIQNLHFKLRDILPQHDRIGQDGLDLALIKLCPNEIQFAGSGRHIVYFDEGNAIEIRGNRSFINFDPSLVKIVPTTHTIKIKPGMNFYLYSDGLTDQFGGENFSKFGNKKLLNLLKDIQDLPMPSQKLEVMLALTSWKGSSYQTDDITMVGFCPQPKVKSG